MKQLLRLLLDLCLLRRGPQDLPYSPALTRGLVLFAIGVDLLFVRALDNGDDGLARIALSTSVALALPWLLLTTRGLQARYLQTLAGFAGTGALFTLAFLPVAMQVAALPPPVPGAEASREQLTLGWIALALIGWHLAINANLWKHALGWPRFAAALLAIGVFLLELGLARAIFAPIDA